MQVEVYVAFSIHNTNCFIRANKKIDLPERPTLNQTVVVDGLNFSASEPRYGRSQDNGVKLLASELNEAYNNRKPDVALNFFHELKNKGWNVIDEDKFVQKHKLAKPIPVPMPVEQVILCPDSTPIVAASDNSETTVAETVIPPVISSEPVINMNPMSVENIQPVEPLGNELNKPYKPGQRQVAIMEFMKINQPMNLDNLHKLFKPYSGSKIGLSDFRDSVNGLIKFGLVVEDNGLLRLA